MRTVTVELKVKLIINANEGVDISEVINEAEHNFKSQTTGADIIDSEITDSNVTDSR